MATLQAKMARAALRAMGGWQLVTEAPEPRRAVILALPHTDNMDGLLLVALTQTIGMPITWMIKDVWTRPPFGWLVRRAGGMAIDRSRAHGVVGQMIEEMKAREDLYLVIPPEGTRRRTDYWKSGFYHIAVGAGVPIVPGCLDYRTKRGGFYEPIHPTGDVRRDMDAIRAVYPDLAAMARHPEKVGPIRLREEDEP
jgi:1-acyl-sn-glycerol-3-phosphate acyltransferase